MKSLAEIKQSLLQEKPLLQKKYRVQQLGIFGSYVRGTEYSDSDLDLLIDYDEAPSLVTLIALEQHLSTMLGMSVDVVTRKGIKPQLRDTILEEVIDL